MNLKSYQFTFFVFWVEEAWCRARLKKFLRHKNHYCPKKRMHVFLGHHSKNYVCRSCFISFHRGGQIEVSSNTLSDNCSMYNENSGWLNKNGWHLGQFLLVFFFFILEFRLIVSFLAQGLSDFKKVTVWPQRHKMIIDIQLLLVVLTLNLDYQRLLHRVIFLALVGILSIFLQLVW